MLVLKITNTRYKRHILICLSTLVVCACSGNGEGLDVNGRPITSDVGGPDTETNGNDISFADIQANILTPSCAFSGCHSGTAAPVGLQLEAEVAYSSLVNQPSVQQSDFARVSPGDPDNSYLIQKLEGTAAVGLQMPRNQPPLSIETIAVIRQWIADGAIDN